VKELTEEYKLLLKKFRTRESGPAVESMNRMGLKYQRNFGIALAELKEFAKNYENEQDFALFLWEKTSREAKILSFMIVNPENLSKEQIDNYILGINNVELAEQAVLNFLYQLPDNYKFALEWCKSSEVYINLTGLLVISRIAMLDKEFDNEKFSDFFEILPDIAKNNNFSLKRGLSRALLQIAKRNDNLNHKVLQFIKSVSNYNEEMAAWLNEEVAYYIVEN